MAPHDLPTNLPDVSRRPPSIPVGLGSKLYPREALDIQGNLPAALQLRRIYLTRRKNEAKHYYVLKHPDHQAFRRYHGSTLNYCPTCSEYVNRKRRDMELVIHRHTSSLNYRINSDHKQSPWGEYFCNTCEVGFHGFKTGSRYPVLVTSSMLKDWQGIRSKNGYRGDKIHVDQIGVSGARISELEFAFLAEYGELYRPTDVLLVSGYNDLVQGQNPNQILADMKSFKNEVLKNEGSSFAASTIPLPPCMSKLEKDQYNLSKPDLTQRIIQLNDMIIQMNKEPGQAMETHRAPCFHTWGLTSRRLPKEIGPRNLLETMPAHAHQDWREKRPTNQLHLSELFLCHI